MERLEELKRQVVAEIERAKQNVRDIHVVEKQVWSNLAKAKSSLRDRRRDEVAPGPQRKLRGL